MSVAGSIGIALYPGHGMAARDLLRCAVYDAKRAGAGCAVYDPHGPSATATEDTPVGAGW